MPKPLDDVSSNSSSTSTEENKAKKKTDNAKNGQGRSKAGRRPLTDPSLRKNQRAIALLTKAEFDRLESVTQFLGKSQSDYIRSLLLPAIERVESEMADGQPHS